MTFPKLLKDEVTRPIFAEIHREKITWLGGGGGRGGGAVGVIENRSARVPLNQPKVGGGVA